MSTDTIRGTRTQNEQATQKLDTSDMTGGVLPRDLFQEWYQTVVDSAALLEDGRTVDLPRPQMDIPRISVGERQRRGADEGEGDTGSGSVNTDAVSLDTNKGTLAYDLTRESVDDTVDNVDEIALNMLARQFAVDTQDLAINGNEDDSSGGTSQEFLTQNDGWLKLLDEDSDTNTYDHMSDPVDTGLFDVAIQAMPNKYLRSDRFMPRFYMNENKVQEYRMALTEREDPLGSAVIFGDNDITPFSYDVVGVAAWPEDEVVFTHSENFIYGLYDEVQIRVLTETDKVAENDLFARYFMRVRDDFAIEDAEGAVHVTNVGA